MKISNDSQLNHIIHERKQGLQVDSPGGVEAIGATLVKGQIKENSSVEVSLSNDSGSVKKVQVVQYDQANIIKDKNINVEKAKETKDLIKIKAGEKPEDLIFAQANHRPESVKKLLL